VRTLARSVMVWILATEPGLYQRRPAPASARAHADQRRVEAAARDAPKPVIARVQGCAIGGANVPCTICDFTIASESAVFAMPALGVANARPVAR